MTGLPDPLQVELDDGTGSWATDISSRVRLVEGLNVSNFGRTDEFNTPTAAALTVVLDNADGQVTDGTISITPGVTPIRVIETIGATTSTRFTGHVATLVLGWPGGGQPFSVVTVTATDALGDLARRPMRAMLEEELLSHSPAALFPLSEASNASAAGDLSANHGTSLTPYPAGQEQATFGGDLKQIDGLTGLTCFGGGGLADIGVLSAATITAPTVFTLFCRFSTTNTGSQSFVTSKGYSLGTDASGNLKGYAPGGVTITGSAVNDGNVHHAAITSDGSTVTLYVDGGSAAAGVPFVAGTGLNNFVVGVLQGGVSPFSGFTGTISHATSFTTALSLADIAGLWTVAGDGATTETTSARFTRLGGYAGLTATATAGNSGQLMVAQATAGAFLLDALMAVAAAEGGVAYATGSGNLTLQGRWYRARKTTATLTLGEQELGADAAVTWDTQQKINQVTVTRTRAGTLIAQNIGTDKLVWPKSIELAVDTDTSALNAATWLLDKHQTTTPRLASVTLDLMTSSNAAAILALDVGDRLSFSALPSQMWASAGDYTIEGWTESLSVGAWTLTLNLLPWSLGQAWVLDASQLDSQTILGY